MAFFSILLPVYNVEKYIKICIDSVLAQKFNDYEVILIDDGSTDNSGAICDEYAAKDERFIVYHKNNEGLLCARRDAIKMAKGEYIMFLDSDDYWADDVLGKVKSTIDSYKCDLIIFSSFSSYEHSIIPESYIYPELTVFEGDSKKELYDLMLTTDLINAVWRKAVKRSIVDVDNDYKEYKCVSLGEDLLQSAIYLINAQKIVYLPERLYYYRRQVGMTSRVKPSYLKQITLSRGHITDLFGTTDFDLRNSIDKQYLNYLTYIAKIMIHSTQNGYKLKESSEWQETLNTEFYKSAKKATYDKTSLLTRSVIKFAENSNFRSLAFVAWLLKLKKDFMKKVRRK